MQAQKLTKRLDFALERARAGDHTWALKQFKGLEKVSTHPEDIAALRLFQATCLTDLGRAGDALEKIASVDRSKLSFSNQLDYEYERARIERALGHSHEALERTEKALLMVKNADNPRDAVAVSRNLLTMRGILLAQAGRCDEAIPILEAVPTEEDGWVEARIYLGDCKYRDKLYQDAIECYLSVMSAEREVHRFYRDAAIRNTGFAYYDLRQYAKAVEYLTQVEHAYDDNPDMKAELHVILASAYSHLGLIREAARYGGFSLGSNSVQ